MQGSKAEGDHLGDNSDGKVSGEGDGMAQVGTAIESRGRGSCLEGQTNRAC